MFRLRTLLPYLALVMPACDDAPTNTIERSAPAPADDPDTTPEPGPQSDGDDENVTDEDAIAIHQEDEYTLYVRDGYVEVTIEVLGLTWFDDWSVILPDTGEIADLVIKSEDELPTLIGKVTGPDSVQRILYKNACCEDVPAKNEECEDLLQDRSVRVEYIDRHECLKGTSYCVAQRGVKGHEAIYSRPGCEGALLRRNVIYGEVCDPGVNPDNCT